MIRYDPDWRADGHPDRRKYPAYLIVLFWSSVTICAGSFLMALISLFLSYSRLLASAIFVLAVGLATIAWVANQSEQRSMR
jgi:hypothetical protein